MNSTTTLICSLSMALTAAASAGCSEDLDYTVAGDDDRADAQGDSFTLTDESRFGSQNFFCEYEDGCSVTLNIVPTYEDISWLSGELVKITRADASNSVWATSDNFNSVPDGSDLLDKSLGYATIVFSVGAGAHTLDFELGFGRGAFDFATGIITSP